MSVPGGEPLAWSSQFQVVNQGRIPAGDKIQLPQSALEQLLSAAPIVTDHDPARTSRSDFDPFNPYTHAAERQARAESAFRHQQLPHPLTFRLVNPENGRIVHAGISEFSAGEGQIGVSRFLAHALGIEGEVGLFDDSKSRRVIRITVHAKQLSKGTFVKLRPLEAGYDPEDWKSLLEDHMRKNYTTLTKGEVLTVPSGRENFQFLIDEFQPAGDGICVVDTDLEVDIEALNEEQALETLKQISAKRKLAPGTAEGSSSGGTLDLFRPEGGQVVPGEYVDYELPAWDRASILEIELRPERDDVELELFASPLSARLRSKPREDEHVFADFEGRPAKRLRLAPTNVELEGADALMISVRATSSSDADQTPRSYGIRARPIDSGSVRMAAETPPPKTTPDEVICKNCHQVVPKQSLILHENFCLRNNVLCPQGCGRVFLRNSPALGSHWHCPHDASTGDSADSLHRHQHVFHTPAACPSCPVEAPSLPLLAQHRTSICPGKLILCRFCHLQVPQEGDPASPSQLAEVSLTGLTPHELVDGARTTECHLCARITRLRDMDTHLRHHDLERKSRPVPRVCRNVNCGRTLDGASPDGDTRANRRKGQHDAGADVGLCVACFAPLYVAMHDPDGKALRRRVERRYLSQLLTGCGRAWCRNAFCQTGKRHAGLDAAASHVSMRDALPAIRPFLDGLRGNATPLHFCTDEMAQASRALAGLLVAEGDARVGQRRYSFAWCVAALEAARGDAGRARDWLRDYAPGVDE